MAKNTLLKSVNRLDTPLAIFLFLCGLMIGRLFIQITLYRQGFVSVSADEFARGLRALAWRENPRFTPAADLIDAWPPFEMYINGPMLLLWDDVLLAPRLTVFIASCFLLVALFFLVRYLFNNLTALLAVSMVAIHPWTIWLSGTPMLEGYFLSCFIGGLYFIVVWLNQQRSLYWLYAGLLFFLASGFHIQSWVLINLVNLFTLIFAYRLVRQRATRQIPQLIGFWLLGNGYIIFWAIAEYVMTGQVFVILGSHTFYSLWFYDGYNVSVSEKLLYFPRIVWSNIAPLLWVLAIAGLIWIWRGSRKLIVLRFLPLMLFVFTLSLASVFNLTSGPPSAAPDRYAFFYLLLLAPCAAYGVYQLGQWSWKIKPYALAYLVTTIIGVGLLGTVIPGMARLSNLPPGNMPQDTIETGQYLHEVLTLSNWGHATSEHAAKNIMVEALYWDFLALELLTRQDTRLIYDREHDYLNRDNPSLFLAHETIVHEQLVQNEVGLVALRNPLLQIEANNLSFLVNEKEIGNWVIYRFVGGSS